MTELDPSIHPETIEQDVHHGAETVTAELDTPANSLPEPDADVVVTTDVVTAAQPSPPSPTSVLPPSNMPASNEIDTRDTPDTQATVHDNTQQRQDNIALTSLRAIFPAFDDAVLYVHRPH